MTAPARLPRTQQARRDETRGALLDAAIESLVAVGVAGTTTLEVQKRAGVSRGALLHHFPSKAALMAGAVEHLARVRGRELEGAAPRLPSRGKARFEAIFDLLWESFTGPLFHVTMDLRAAARTDPELAEALRGAEQAIYGHIVATYRRLLGPALASQPGFDRAFELTLQLMIGAATTALLHTEERSRIEALLDDWKAIFPKIVGAGES
jgi:AcrR family transcriptional regulator